MFRSGGRLIEEVKNRAAMTNYEKIKTMTIDEFMDFVMSCGCQTCIFEHGDLKCADSRLCSEGIKKWLESEVEE